MTNSNTFDALGNKSNIPKTRTDYWLDKLENNKKRDFQNKQLRL